MPNTDDLIAAMEADELADAVKMTPRDYAKYRGMSPQLVYYYLRTKKLPSEICECGRKVVDRKVADDFFRSVSDAKSGDEITRSKVDKDEA